MCVCAVLSKLVPPLLFVYGVVFAVVHYQNRFTTAFQLHFAVMVSVTMTRLVFHYRACRDPAARLVFRLYLYTLLAGVAVWLIDFHLCSHLQSLVFNPQGR